MVLALEWKQLEKLVKLLQIYKINDFIHILSVFAFAYAHPLTGFGNRRALSLTIVLVIGNPVVSTVSVYENYQIKK